ncbi:MAG: hypothetical protein BGN92_03710 [Sphingobacteriales bacterium 41-5]|nr:MAG: hypothetical protein BGN92_03710 [Sphingobacteriales bacterium 41-5]
MQKKHLYEYAVIRIVPRVEREEFVNAGIILFCKKAKFLKCIYTIDASRLRAVFPEIDIDVIQKNLEAFENIAHGNAKGGPIAKLDVPERFRWLTASRSTIIQTGKVHPGLAEDNENIIQRLFDELVKNG